MKSKKINPCNITFRCLKRKNICITVNIRHIKKPILTPFPKFTEKISINLTKSSEAVYVNGSQLLNESRLLFDNGHFSRATSLAILAEEELSKSFILRIAVIGKRWDRELFKSLRSHQRKQAVSIGTRKITNEFLKIYYNSMHGLIPHHPTFDTQKADEIIKITKKDILKKNTIDTLKQDAQFVNIGESGEVIKSPSSINEKDAAEQINSATIFQALAGTIMGKTRDDHPLLRSLSRINCSDHNSITKIMHKSGVDIVMDILDRDISGTTDKVLLNPYHVLSEFPSLDPDELNEGQCIILSKLYVFYKAIGQMRKCMFDLGLRKIKYIDNCVEMIEKYHGKDSKNCS